MSARSSRQGSKSQSRRASRDHEQEQLQAEHQELLADSARLVTSQVAGFKEDNREEGEQAQTSNKELVKGVAKAFKSEKKSVGGYNEALGVSNLEFEALSNENASREQGYGLGSDRTGIAQEVQEALADKGSKSTRTSRRKSSNEAAPKVSKVKKAAMQEALKELLPISDESVPKNVKMQGERCLVKIGDQQRPIRMDTRESHAPRLNGLVQDIKRTRLHEHNREHNRIEKVRSLNKEISRLTYQRAEYSLAVSNWSSESWRWVNANRTRCNPEEMLQDCAPAKRLGALRSIEKQCMAAVSQGTRPPSPTRRPPTIRAWV